MSQYVAVCRSVLLSQRSKNKSDQIELKVPRLEQKQKKQETRQNNLSKNRCATSSCSACSHHGTIPTVSACSHADTAPIDASMRLRCWIILSYIQPTYQPSCKRVILSSSGPPSMQWSGCDWKKFRCLSDSIAWLNSPVRITTLKEFLLSSTSHLLAPCDSKTTSYSPVPDLCATLQKTRQEEWWFAPNERCVTTRLSHTPVPF